MPKHSPDSAKFVRCIHVSKHQDKRNVLVKGESYKVKYETAYSIWIYTGGGKADIQGFAKSLFESIED